MYVSSHWLEISLYVWFCHIPEKKHTATTNPFLRTSIYLWLLELGEYFLQYCYIIDHWACSSIGSISSLSLNLDICSVSTGRSSFNFSFPNYGVLDIYTRQWESYQNGMYILVLYTLHQIYQKLSKLNIPFSVEKRNSKTEWKLIHV